MREAPARDLLRDTAQPARRPALGRRHPRLRAAGAARGAAGARSPRCSPPFALIAGGRPDQAAALESRGIATYLHVPSPGLLRRFLDRGARRFVFEGRECGGHVGPLSSFVLWEAMVETLLDHAPPARVSTSSTSCSPAASTTRCRRRWCAALAAPLARARRADRRADRHRLPVHRGGRRHAAPSSAASSRRRSPAPTRSLLETGPGHATRCAPTPVRRRVPGRRQPADARGSAPAETHPRGARRAEPRPAAHRLQGARRATGRRRRARAGRRPSAQRRDGMYMIGQVADAAPRGRRPSPSCTPTSAEARRALLAARRGRATPLLAQRMPRTRPADVAIVGMGCAAARRPATSRPSGTTSSHKVDAITEIPPHRWDWRASTSTRPQGAGQDLLELGRLPRRRAVRPAALRHPAELAALDRAARSCWPWRWRAGRSPTPATRTGDFDRERTVGHPRRRRRRRRPRRTTCVRAALPLIVRRPGIRRRLAAAARVDRGLLRRHPAQRRRRPGRQPLRPRRRQLHRRRRLRLVAGRASTWRVRELRDRPQRPGRRRRRRHGADARSATCASARRQALSPRGRCRTFDAGRRRHRHQRGRRRSCCSSAWPTPSATATASTR